MTEDSRRARPRGGVVGGVLGRVVPAVVSRVDVNEVLEYVDVNEVAARLDLDALVDRLDVDQVAARLDLDALVERLDVNRVAERIDLDVLVERLDVDQVADRLDLDVLVDRLDVNKVAARLDLDALVDRLDVDQVAARLDLDALVERLDVNRAAERIDLDVLVERLDVNTVAERLDLDDLVQRIDMARLTAGATQDVALSGLDLVRRQFVRADATVDSVVGRVVRRDGDHRPAGPAALLAAEPVAAERTDTAGTPRRRAISGHYAGPVTRVTAIAGDVFAAASLFGLFATVIVAALSVVSSGDLSSGGWLALALAACWHLVWFWLPIALFGRTPAMALVGVAVVTRDGGVVGAGRALVRALVFPISIGLLLLGLIGLLLGRERRALHDVLAGTVVVYDWGEREAEQPATIRDLLDARVRRRRRLG